MLNFAHGKVIIVALLFLLSLFLSDTSDNPQLPVVADTAVYSSTTPPEPQDLTEPPAAPATSAPPTPINGPVANDKPKIKAKAAPAKGEILYTPNDAAKFAAQDIEKNVPVDLRPFTVYLSLYNIPSPLRPRLIETLSFVLNSLSRNSRIIPVGVVEDTDNTLVRINFIDFRWKAESWDRLAQKDVYFSTTLVHIIETPEIVVKTRQIPTRNFDGSPGTTTERYEEKVINKKETTIHDLAPWIAPQYVSKLKVATLRNIPILRADWFIVKAFVAPAYYDFLQFGENEIDFQKALGFTDETIKLLKDELLREIRAAVVRSGVTTHNRRLNRLPGILGFYWFSSDFLTNVDKQNMLRIQITDDADASEQIATSPNGLQWYFVVNKQRKRLNKADPDIAIDTNFPDHQVIVGRSCAACHATGILSFKSDSKRLVRDDVKIKSADPTVRQLLLSLYDIDFDDFFSTDQAIYAKAIKKCNGLTPKDNAAQYRDIYLEYAETDVTLADISYELGADTDTITEVFKKANDPILLGLIKKDSIPMLRDYWEEIFTVAASALYLKKDR